MALSLIVLLQTVLNASIMPANGAELGRAPVKAETSNTRSAEPAAGSLFDVRAPDLGSLTLELPSFESLQGKFDKGLREGDSCEGVDALIDKLQEEILEVKARYWAWLLRHSGTQFEIRRGPGSLITDRELRSYFYSRMKHYYDMRVVPEPSKEEVEWMSERERKAVALHNRCRSKSARS